MWELITKSGLKTPQMDMHCRAIDKFLRDGNTRHHGTQDDRIAYLKTITNQWQGKRVQHRFFSPSTAPKGIVDCVIPLSEIEFEDEKVLRDNVNVPDYKLLVVWEDKKKVPSKVFPDQIKIISHTKPEREEQ